MRDLELWRRLEAGDGAGIEDALEALAARPMGARAPFLGAIARLAEAGEPAVRAAAVRVLAGTRGVPGVRAIVRRLDDEDEGVRRAAIAALRATAGDAPMRYAHALFHRRAEVRREALTEVPRGAGELAAYLRGDPACAEAAAAVPWPSEPLPLAFDLHAAGAISDRDLLGAMATRTAADLRVFLEGERGRDPEVVDAYLERVLAAGRWLPAPGLDPLDQVFAAIDGVAGAKAAPGGGADETEGAAEGAAAEAAEGAGGTEDARLTAVAEDGAEGAADARRRVVAAARAQIVEATCKDRALVRRAVVSLISGFAARSGASAHLIGILCAFEPRVLELASFDPAHADAAADGLLQLRWPVRIAPVHVERLLQGRLARADLRLAVALAGLFPAQRLRTLAKIRGESALVDELLASDRGWDELCGLPGEMPPQELIWLAAIEAASPERYVELAGRALAVIAGKRLEAFLDRIPAKHRAGAFLRFTARRELAPGAPVIATVSGLVATRLDRAALADVFEALLAGDARGAALARELVRAVPLVTLAAVARGFSDAAAASMVAAADGPDALPRNRELALAKAFTGRADPAIRAWVLRVSQVAPAAGAGTAGATPRGPARRELLDVERDRIATCPEGELEAALAPALAAPVSGLVPALARRAPCESVAACVALVACADPYPEVAAQLDRFAGTTRGFENRLDRRASAWSARTELLPLAHAWLFRWEAHDLALARWIEAAGGVLAALASVDVPGAFAARLMWRGIAEVVMFLRYRDHDAFQRLATPALAAYAAERIDRPIGRDAARILVALVEGGVVTMSEIRTAVLDRAAGADAEAREHLGRVLRLDGIPAPPRREAHPPAGPELLAKVRGCKAIYELIPWCRHARPDVVQEAVLALSVRGEDGQLALAALLAELAALPAPVPVLASIALWDSAAALAKAREIAAAGALPPEWRFHLALGLVARGDAGELPRALDAARAEAPPWFRREDWERLIELSDPRTCALALADSPHHPAYLPALRLLLEERDEPPAARHLREEPQATQAPDVGAALRRFLEAGSDRPLHLRRAAARRLAAEHGDLAGLPLLIEELADTAFDSEPSVGLELLDGLPPAAARRVLEALVDAALVGGDRACTEKRMWSVLAHLRDAGRVPDDSLDGLYARVLDESSEPGVRRAAAVLATTARATDERLGAVAEVFAWGVRRGLELTGRRLRVHMTSAERDLGHTRLTTDRINVSPLPMLRGEPHGVDVVEGLILHELGHHVYHRGEAAEALWNQAHDEGLGHLLNLVADEHLERNLRALDPAYGDRLKRLGAFAFHHAAEEIRVAALLDCLRGHAARALIAAEPEVAFDDGSLRLRRGAVLGELDRAGHPLARFARALRMGLGNRHGDPIVAAALELCGKGLRRLDMRGLYDLTRRLAAMFGGATAVARVFGGPEGLSFGERDGDVHGAGIDDDALQREVERILEPRRGGSGTAGPRDRLCINVNPDERFDRITHVVRVHGDRAEHARLASEVKRHAARLRALLDELGLRREPMKARLSGHALDRGRLRALVTRGDPRILIARTPVRRTDLFLGTVIDCSGSMTAGDNIERARRFAVLIGEAVRPLAGVEARFFGFTDSQIYDAGDAADCGVTALEAGGGNNDAAALLHAANAAAASRRRAKVLVMISDGLPTECSVAAVRGLVTTLTRRRGMVCAQVAVRPLEEVMFPHHLVLDDTDPGVAVARFGRMIAGLARRVLAP